MAGKAQNKICTIVGCGRRHLSRGYCTRHYQRWSKNLPLDVPKYDNRKNKKGWIMGGYRWISTPDRGEILEHRYVMEQHIGRRLDTDELVHHKNGDKIDNRLCNLEIMGRPEHTAHHRAHSRPCLICGESTLHGTASLCAMHSQKMKRLMQRLGIAVPSNKFGYYLVLMGLALADDSQEVIDRITDLQITEGT